MLAHLQIRNLVLIEDASLSFAPGFNVLTGETGAGKSLVVTSLDLLLGKRAQSTLVRKNADSAEIEGLFDISQLPHIRSRVAEAGFGEDDELLIRRIVHKDGKNRVYINGKLASVAVLSTLTDGLAGVMSQHEQNRLFDTAYQRVLLDRFGGLEDLLTRMESAHGHWSDAVRTQKELDSQRRHRTERIEFLDFWITELDALDPKADEYQSLCARIERAKHREQIFSTAYTCASELYEHEGSVYERLGQLISQLQALENLDPSLAQAAQALDEATVLVEETARSLAKYTRDADEDVDVDTLIARTEEYKRLAHKHQVSPDELADVREALVAERARLSALEESLEAAAAEVATRRDEMAACARRLTAARTRAARTLAAAVEGELADLHFDGARFQVAVEPSDDFHPWGCDDIAFHIAPNRGEGMHPLRKTASGGELSRILLAVKRALLEAEPHATYVFDEIDAGLGGEAANAVARKIAQLATRHQIICITHLPPIAALADAHFHIDKQTHKGRTITRITPLADDATVRELARMIGGSDTKALLDAARELRTALQSPGQGLSKPTGKRRTTRGSTR